MDIAGSSHRRELQFLATRCSGPEVDLVRGIVLFMVGPGSSCNMYAKQYYAK